jgi:hypothetical protein
VSCCSVYIVIHYCWVNPVVAGGEAFGGRVFSSSSSKIFMNR